MGRDSKLPPITSITTWKPGVRDGGMRGEEWAVRDKITARYCTQA